MRSKLQDKTRVLAVMTLGGAALFAAIAFVADCSSAPTPGPADGNTPTEEASSDAGADVSDAFYYDGPCVGTGTGCAFNEVCCSKMCVAIAPGQGSYCK